MQTVISRARMQWTMDAATAPAYSATLRVWLIVGAASLVVFPSLRATDDWFGWLPFWLVIAPALDLAFLRRRQLLAEAVRLVARVHQRRRAARRQALALSRPRARPRRRPRSADSSVVLTDQD